MGRVTYDFTDETAIVTGGSSGIGRAIATKLGNAGCTVIVADIREQPKDTDAEQPTHKRIRDAGGEAVYVETDVTDPERIANAIETANELDGLDILVNNAGGSIPASIREITPKTFGEVWSLNVEGLLFSTQQAANQMIDDGTDGVILNLASIRSEFAHPEQVAYDATKGAVKMITRYSAFEFAEYGIRVNAVAPGPIATDTRSDTNAEALREQIANGEYTKPVPLMRAGEPEDIANAVAFLSSDDASYVTGEVVFVDGGYQVY
jgi:NAD(P)-dependent dehydrogenase (short-subunit alcohol dehydrogenase family)